MLNENIVVLGKKSHNKASETYLDVKIINPSFAISLGCKPNGPIYIQLLAPLVFSP